jgi:hypothetical protein
MTQCRPIKEHPAIRTNIVVVTAGNGKKISNTKKKNAKLSIKMKISVELICICRLSIDKKDLLINNG